MLLRSTSNILPVLTLALYAVASTLAQISTSNTACTQHYVVQDGDTCDKIGQKTFTSTYQIMALNLPLAGPNCYGLEVGVVSLESFFVFSQRNCEFILLTVLFFTQQLCLGTWGNDCQLVHRAVDSDTCESIEAQYNITRAILKTNNPNLSCGQVYSGLMLCVTQGIIRPPSNSAVNITYNPLSPGLDYMNATMPLGTAVVATNAPASSVAVVTQVVTIIPGESTSTTLSSSTETGTAAAAAASSGSTSSSSSSAKSTSTAKKDKHHDTHWGHHHDHHKGHAAHHKAAAKKYHEAHKQS